MGPSLLYSELLQKNSLVNMSKSDFARAREGERECATIRYGGQNKMNLVEENKVKRIIIIQNSSEVLYSYIRPPTSSVLHAYSHYGPSSVHPS